MSEIRTDTAQYSCKVSGTTFQVLSFSAHEEISGLFMISLTLWSEDPEVGISSKIRQTAEVKVKWGSNEKAYYGIVATFSQTDAGIPGLGGVDRPFGQYTAVVVPTLWLLGHKSNCRIFQQLSADAIIKKVLDERGMAGKYESRMSSYPVREYCVQYRESDLTFISRLMEEEGVFYHFTHQDRELMVIGDSAGAYGDSVPESSVEYRTGTGGLATSREYLSSLVYEEGAHSGKVRWRDFDYRDPTKPLRVEQTAALHSDLELYDYGVERYRDDGRGRGLAKVAVDAHAAMEKTLAASGSWRSASAGCKLTLSRAYRGDCNRDWVVVRCDHRATQEASSGVQAWVSLLAIPADVAFKSPPRAQRPFLNPQTAKVVGPAGKKFHMDELGRAKVQFRWDVDGQENQDSSCWIRVAQPYAGFDEESGHKHGFQWHPMIGDEVVVDFVDGDPDTPLITGSVYNAVNRPIVDPGELVRGRILTPYQHQLLLDDANATIRLNTGGSEFLEMVDKRREEGRVKVETVGAQRMRLEDNDDTAGNMVEMWTSGGHHLFMGERDRSNGIMIKTIHGHRVAMSDANDLVRVRTQSGHHLELDDPNRFVEIKTAGGHTMRMDDGEKIRIQSTGGGSFEINDVQRKIELSSPTGEQKLTIDYSGTGLGLKVTKGNVEVGAPTGSIEIKGQKISVSSDTELNLSGNDVMIMGKNVDINGTAQVNVYGPTVAVTADGSLTAKGATTTIEGTGTVEVKGGAVTSSASGINIVKGTLVKIN